MPENSKKNKRGARGSVEDNVNEAKRQLGLESKHLFIFIPDFHGVGIVLE